MAADADAGGRAPATIPPPRTETGAIGWVYANLFSSRHNAALTIIVGALAGVGLVVRAEVDYFRRRLERDRDYRRAVYHRQLQYRPRLPGE